MVEPVTQARDRYDKSHPKNWDGSVLVLVPETATALLPLATALGLGACGGGVVVASCSVAACTQEPGATARGVRYLKSYIVGGVAATAHRRT